MPQPCNLPRPQASRAITLLWLLVMTAAASGTATPRPVSEVELSERVQQLPQDEQQRYLRLADQLRCPTCVGLSVFQSSAPFSLQMRLVVLDHMAAGASDQQILDFFISRYGLWILRAPPTSGVHLLAWILPPGLVAVFAVLLWMFLRRKEHPAQMASRQELVAEFEAALQRKREQPCSG